MLNGPPPKLDPAQLDPSRLQSLSSATAALAEMARARGASPEAYARLAARVAKLLDAELTQVRVHGVHLACRAGCSDCCHLMIYATGPEILRVWEAIQAFDDEARGALQRRSAAYASIAEPYRAEQFTLLRQPCPLLENGQCSVYDQRPLMCRGLCSEDSSMCSVLKANPLAMNHFAPNRELDVVAAAANGMMAGLAARGRLYELGPTLAQLFRGDLTPDDIAKAPGAPHSPPPNAPWRQAFPVAPPTSRGPTFQAFTSLEPPTILRSPQDSDAQFKRLERGVQQLATLTPLNPSEAYAALGQTTLVSLGYHRISMKDLMESLGKTIEAHVASQLAPDLLEPVPARQPGKIRVGLAGNMAFSSSAAWSLGWTRHLDRTDFEVHVVKVSGPDDAATYTFRESADQFHSLAGNPLAVARYIRSLDLDYLIWTDIGDNAAHTQFAMFRLARRQAAAWGCPFTSGLTTIDDYLSSEAMEPADGPSHYTENLVRLPRLGFTLSDPDLRFATRTRERLGLPEGFLAAFPQAVFKWGPEYDDLLAEVASRTGNPIVLLAKGRPEDIRAFDDRMRRAAVPALWLPEATQVEFNTIVSACDVLLDSPTWSGGITAIQGLLLGKPTVTLDGPFLRQRLAAGACRVANAGGLIARDLQDYVDLATSPTRLTDAMAKATPDLLLNDLQPLRVLEDYIKSTV